MVFISKATLFFHMQAQNQRHQRELAFFTRSFHVHSYYNGHHALKRHIAFKNNHLSLRLSALHAHTQTQKDTQTLSTTCRTPLPNTHVEQRTETLPSVMYGECISVSSSSCGHPIVCSDLEPWNTEQKQWEFRHNGALKEQQDGTLSTVYFHCSGKAQRDWAADHAYVEMHVDAQETVLCVDGYLYSGERIIIMNILYPIIYEHKGAAVC